MSSVGGDVESFRGWGGEVGAAMVSVGGGSWDSGCTLKQLYVQAFDALTVEMVAVVTVSVMSGKGERRCRGKCSWILW